MLRDVRHAFRTLARSPGYSLTRDLRGGGLPGGLAGRRDPHPHGARAQRRDVHALVFREGMRLAGVGVLLGSVGAIATTRWLRSELYKISARDPVTLVLAALVLAGIGIIATLVPARRATAIDPLTALRHE